MSARSSRGIFGDRARRIVLVLIGLSATGTVAAIVFGGRLAPLRATQRDTFGVGPIGHRALAESLGEVGYYVRISTGDRFEGPSAPLLFLEPELDARVEGRARTLGDAIRVRREGALPTVVVLPKWDLVVNQQAPRAEPDTLQASHVLEEVLGAERAPDPMQGFGRLLGGGQDDDSPDVPEASEPPGQDPLEQALQEIAGLHGGKGRGLSLTDGGESSTLAEGELGSFELVVPRLQVFDVVPSGMTPLLETPAGAVVVGSSDGLILVSDPDLSHTFALHRGDHLALWLALLTRLAPESDTVVIDEVFHGHGRVHSLSKALGQFPAVLIVIHALLVILLVLRFGAVRFGSTLELPPREHGPVAAIATSASVLADGQELRLLARRYVEEVLEDLARHLGVELHRPEERALEIDRIAARRGIAPEAVRLLGAAARLPEGRKEAQKAAWTVARAAHTFRERMMGSRRGSVAIAPTADENDDGVDTIPSAGQGPAREGKSAA